MIGPQERSWLLDGVRTLLSAIDKLVYQGVELVLQGIFDLASLKTSSGLLTDIYTKIYVLVGIIMAFKLSFSFFQYIVNPDNMSDKNEKGVSNLFIRLFLMLLLLVTLPSLLFGGNGSKGLLTETQEIILPMIPNLLLKDGDSAPPPRETVKDAATQMTVASLSAFYFQPKELKDKCEAPPIENLDDFTNTVNARCGFLGKHYQYTYIYVANFVVGLLLLIMFLDISIDVAKRVFKLLILEILAPIPIISYIDPKSAKDGAFSKWVQSLISTFLSLFIKIGIIYLVLFFITKVIQNGLFENFPAFADEPLRSAYLTIFLILGLIYFAKEAPKFITDSLGLKDTGGDKFGFGTIAALGGAIGAGMASARASRIGDEAKGGGKEKLLHNRAKHLGAGLLGGAAGLGTGIAAAADKNKAADVNKALRERNARTMAAATSGSSFFGRLGAQSSSVFLGESSAAKLQRQVTADEGRQAVLKGILEHAGKEVEKKNDTFGHFKGTSVDNFEFNYKDVNARHQVAMAQGQDSYEIVDRYGGKHNLTASEFIQSGITLKDDNAADYIANFGLNLPDGNDKKDKDMSRMLENAAGLGLGLDQKTLVDRKEARNKIKAQSKELELKINKNKDSLEKAKANDRHAGK